ncbi:MAG: hypothetical protein IJD60_08625 [Clostridia bacterium]|nr:hypothetical protein [Clostridia bacterium]
MKIWQNGSVRNMTEEEIKAHNKEMRRAALEERRRSMSQDEVSRLLIAQQINSLDVDDNTALRMKEFYPAWTAGTAYPAGHKLRYDGRLWRVMQAHTSQTGWEPDQAASLFEMINETHEGTEDDPIPYSGNMALVSGLIYAQDGEFYRCIRDSGNPVYHNLADLVGLYAEVLE